MQNILQSTFGLQQFRPGQEAVITRLLAGQSALAIFPTGAGKSLCYQLPAVALDGLTLVVSPLIALMKDQLDALRRRGVAAARLDSSLTAQESRAVYSDLRQGLLRLLYIAPERLGNERFLATLKDLPISLLAVDEAHCISEWGHNFRPDYMKLAQLARELQVPRVLALTATATPAVAESIARAFEIPAEGIIRSPFHRQNLHLDMCPGEASSRNSRLLSSLQPGPNIVYVTLQRTAEEVAEFLTEQGRPAVAYHAGLEAEQRARIQDEFMASPNGVVVATIAFGMGVDKADIRAVIHYNLPKSIENYAQEIGRAGRDGQTSRCTLLAAPEDAVNLENFTFGDTPTAEALGGLLAELEGSGECFDVSVYHLSQQHDIRNLVVETILTYLELDGVLQATQPFFAEYKISWRTSEADVISRFEPARAQFLRSVFACAQKGRKWLRLDAHQASIRLKEPREKIIKTLNYLEEQGLVLLQASGVRKGYRRVGSFGDPQSLIHRFRTREQRDLARLEEMQRLVYGQGCTARALLAYFGESMESDCGVCGRCLGQSSPTLLRQVGEVDADQLSRIEKLKQQHHSSLAHPRQLARFLCGLTSPATSAARLGRHVEFGMLADIPFQRVLALLERGPNQAEAQKEPLQTAAGASPDAL
ncbi:MAG: RecQ family ATP-dependent DNA helicase [Candidatus Eremiobacteraeota bacterium]|nr:RecQ family ATP-dependent DNA helicase [Candidatus Eremiobacteraeota bacterium]